MYYPLRRLVIPVHFMKEDNDTGFMEAAGEESRYDGLKPIYLSSDDFPVISLRPKKDWVYFLKNIVNYPFFACDMIHLDKGSMESSLKLRNLIS